MKNKILFTVILFAVFSFVPILKVCATGVYVGVQIKQATAPGFPSGVNWCLPAGTQMAVAPTSIASCGYATGNYNASTVCNNCSGGCLSATGPSTNPVTSPYPLCPLGNTIWSGLINLTSGSNYEIYLYTPNFCSGYNSSYGLCLETDTTGENCCNVCAHYGQTAVIYSGTSSCTANTTGCYYYGDYGDTTCNEIAQMTGTPCATCTNVAPYTWYTPDSVNPTKNDCNVWDNYNDCTAAPSGLTRVCACSASGPATGFLFPFTASGF